MFHDDRLKLTNDDEILRADAYTLNIQWNSSCSCQNEQKNNGIASGDDSLPTSAVKTKLFTNDRGSTNRAEIFLPEALNKSDTQETSQGSDETNPWINWLRDLKLLWDLNPMDEENHGKIATYYGCKDKYDAMVGDNEPKTRAQKFYKLLLCVQNVKVKRNNEKDQINGSIAMMEGNHRWASLVYTALNAEFNELNGNVKIDTLTKEWLAPNVEVIGWDNVETLQELTKKKGSTREWVDDSFDSNDNVLNRKIRCVVYYGKTKEQVKELELTTEMIGRILEGHSEKLSEDKTGSVIPSETVTIGKVLKQVVMDFENNKKLVGGSIPTYGKHGGTYLAFPCSGAQGIVSECEIWKWDETKHFIQKPTIETSTRWKLKMKTPLVNVAKNGKVTRTMKKTSPPFHVTDEALGSGFGEYLMSDKRTKKGDNDTIKAKHMPLGVEEANKMLVLTMVFDCFYRAFHQIERRGWGENPKKKDAELELEYLLQTAIATKNMGTIGNKFNNSDERFGVFDQATPIQKERAHWGAALLVAEICDALMAGDRTRELKWFADAIYSEHVNHDEQHSDLDFVMALGE